MREAGEDRTGRWLKPMNWAMIRSAWCPAATRSGIAGASALKIVSTIVIGKVIQLRIAAGFTALTTRPGGAITSASGSCRR